MSPTSCAFSMIACGQPPSRSSSQATGRISFVREVVRELAEVLLLVGQREIDHGLLLRGAGAVRLTGQSTVYPQGSGLTRKFDPVDGAIIADGGRLRDARFVVAAVGAIVAVFTRGAAASSYSQIGGGGLDAPIGDDAPPGPPPPDERDDEIRQLLEARNARRVRRGEAPLDVEAELAALIGAALAPGAPRRPASCARRFARSSMARNARRARAGLEPLDVDAEIARRLRELT